MHDPRSQFREELAKLKQIQHKRIENYNCTVINAPIAVLKKKEKDQVIFVLGTTLLNARTQYDKLGAGYEQLKAMIVKKIEDVESDDPKSQATYTFKEVADMLKPFAAHEIPKEMPKLKVHESKIAPPKEECAHEKSDTAKCSNCS